MTHDSDESVTRQVRAPRAIDAYWMSDGVRVRLTDGRLLRIPFGYAAELHKLPPAAQRALRLTTDGAAITWPAVALTIQISAIIDASHVVVDPGPGETLPLDVTTRGEDWA